MQYIQGFDLADPAHVILPHPLENPVAFLPIDHGLACEFDGCGHLCVTSKRMKSHWAKIHNGVTVRDAASFSPVCLQTFFRGNQLRYFRVSREPKQSAHSSTADVEVCDIEIDLLEISPAGFSTWSSRDLELLDHFKTSASLDLGKSPSTRECWQVAVPKLAAKHSFLKHGLLACSALHRAKTNPAEKKHYQFIAALYQNQALPEFRIAIDNVNDYTCNALLAFSYLLIINCVALEEQDEDLFFVGGKDESGLPEWLKVIRGSCAIFGHTWDNISKGPLHPLVLEGMNSSAFDLNSETSEDAARLDILFQIPFLGQNLTAKQVCEEKPSPFPRALMKLHEAFSKTRVAHSLSKFTLWTVVHAVSNAYFFPSTIFLVVFESPVVSRSSGTFDTS